MSKSLMDHMEVKEHPSYSEAMAPYRADPDLVQCGSCPKCGAPIYGPRYVKPGATEVTVKYGCECRNLA